MTRVVSQLVRRSAFLICSLIAEHDTAGLTVVIRRLHALICKVGVLSAMGILRQLTEQDAPYASQGKTCVAGQYRALAECCQHPTHIGSRTAGRRDHWDSQNYAGERNKILRQHIAPKPARPVPSKNREPGSGTTVRFPVPLKLKVAYGIMNWPYPRSVSWKVPIPVPLETKLAISGPGVTKPWPKVRSW
jgi:hypothetical protein